MADEVDQVPLEHQSNAGKWVLILAAIAVVAVFGYTQFMTYTRIAKLNGDLEASQAQVKELQNRMQTAEAQEETLARQSGMTKKELAQRAAALQAAQKAAEARLEQEQKAQITAVTGDIAVFLFDGPVVGGHIHRVFALLNIGLLQLQAHGRNRLRLGALQKGELVIIAVAFVLQNVQIAGGMSDQTALHAQITNRALQLGFGGFQVGLGRSDIGADATHIRLHACDIPAYGANLSFLLLFQAGLRGFLRGL